MDDFVPYSEGHGTAEMHGAVFTAHSVPLHPYPAVQSFTLASKDFFR